MAVTILSKKNNYKKITKLSFNYNLKLNFSNLMTMTSCSIITIINNNVGNIVGTTITITAANAAISTTSTDVATIAATTSVMGLLSPTCVSNWKLWTVSGNFQMNELDWGWSANVLYREITNYIPVEL